mgnify:CR=1 FL=1
MLTPLSQLNSRAQALARQTAAAAAARSEAREAAVIEAQVEAVAPDAPDVIPG